MYNPIIDQENQCYGCGVCVKACPKSCLSLTYNPLGFRYVTMEKPNECISCGLCTQRCPHHQKISNKVEKISRFYAQNKDAEIRKSSSSGGVFSALASTIFEQGGIVWGVQMTADGTTKFTSAKNEVELDALRGSKYVEIGEMIPFENIKQCVDSGKLVMFTGTPCQVQAMYSYMSGKIPENLVLVDLLCYGIQSPKMWNAYLQEVNPEGKGIQRIAMRKHVTTWESYSMEIQYEDGSRYSKSRWKDPYLLTYSQNLYNRSSCSNCMAKAYPKISDITIGDFWQIDALPHMPDDIKIREGVSVILTHSDKGIELLNKTDQVLILHEIPKSVLPNLLKRYSGLSKKNQNKEAFIQLVESVGFAEATKKVIPSQIKKRCRFIWLAAKRKLRQMACK